VNDRTRGLVVLFGAAAAAGIYMGVKRTAQEKPAAAIGSSSATAAAPTPSVTPPHTATRHEIETTIGRLERAVKGGASRATSPWALAHGLIAFGPKLEASDGRLAIDVIGSFAEKRDVDGGKVWGFPESKNGELVEPHPFLLVKTLLDIGVPLDRKLRTSTGDSVTLGALVADLHRSAKVPNDAADFHQVAWELSALALDEKLQPAVAEKAPGPQLVEVTELCLARLERDQRVVAEYTGPLERAFDDGTPLNRAKRDKTGIYGHTCGGLHLVQAVASSVALSKDEALKKRFRKQLGVLLYRYELERAAYASLLLRHPAQGLIVRIQQQKFFGHLVETLTLARSLGLVDETTEGGKRIDTVIRRASGDVATVVGELEGGGVYQRLDAVKKKREQSYLDLIGDGCHAIRGLRRALELY
jgi:hypothetical protein